MEPGLFILTISLYLVSLVASLISAFFYRHISFRVVNVVLIFHILVLLTWIIFPAGKHDLSNPGTSNYLFLSYFCSGILLAGIILRGRYHITAKIYFILFLLSLVFFLVSPSRLIGFIASGMIDAYSPDRIHLSENYFLVQQNETSVVPHPDSVYYKAVREMGMFHKTLIRDIALPRNYDSVSVRSKQQDENIKLTVYRNRSKTEITIPVAIQNKN